MGLRRLIPERTLSDVAITVVMCAVALALHVWVPRGDAQRALAREYVDAAERVGGAPVFRAGERAVLFFDVRGSQGPIRGAVVVDGDKLERVVLISAREGLDRAALQSPRFLDSFRDQPANRTVVVDVVSGASISSRIFMGAVNRQLQRWRKLRVSNQGKKP